MRIGRPAACCDPASRAVAQSRPVSTRCCRCCGSPVRPTTPRIPMTGWSPHRGGLREVPPVGELLARRHRDVEDAKMMNSRPARVPCRPAESAAQGDPDEHEIEQETLMVICGSPRRSFGLPLVALVTLASETSLRPLRMTGASLASAQGVGGPRSESRVHLGCRGSPSANRRPPIG